MPYPIFVCEEYAMNLPCSSSDEELLAVFAPKNSAQSWHKEYANLYHILPPSPTSSYSKLLVSARANFVRCLWAKKSWNG